MKVVDTWSAVLVRGSEVVGMTDVDTEVVVLSWGLIVVSMVVLIDEIDVVIAGAVIGNVSVVSNFSLVAGIVVLIAGETAVEGLLVVTAIGVDDVVAV